MLGEGGADDGGGVGGSILIFLYRVLADRVESGARISGSCLSFNVASSLFVIFESQYELEDDCGGGFFTLTAIVSSSVT